MGAMTDHQINHAYTVLEIDRMREAIKGFVYPCVWVSRNTGFGGDPDHDQVERQLRTYMLNGTRAEELEILQREAEELSETQRLAFPDHLATAA